MKRVKRESPDLPSVDTRNAGEAALDVIRRRRSIRRYTDQDVSPAQVEELLEMAMCAPSRLDRRPWHFVVIRDYEVKERLAELLRVHPYLETAPVVIAIAALPEASSTWKMDVSAATENLLLAATAMGLGATWLGQPDTALWDQCEKVLMEELAIPGDDKRFPVLVTVGYPAQELPPHGRHDRFDGTRVHYGKWGAHQPA